MIVVGTLLVPLVLVAALLRPYSGVTFADTQSHAIDLDVRLGVGQLTIAAPSGATTTETTR